MELALRDQLIEEREDQLRERNDLTDEL